MGGLVGTPQYARQLAALEALQIYAPLGHGLGLRPLCAQLEDRCFQVCYCSVMHSLFHKLCCIREQCLESCLKHSITFGNCMRPCVFHASLPAISGMFLTSALQQGANTMPHMWRSAKNRLYINVLYSGFTTRCYWFVAFALHL